MISNPSRFREYGEELILDVQEGLAREESVATTQEAATESTRQHAVSQLVLLCYMRFKDRLSFGWRLQ